MNLLLDTHIFIWWDSSPSNLSAAARAALSDSTNTLMLSVASIWEMQIKANVGKLMLRAPLKTLIEEQGRANELKILPVEDIHVYALNALSYDPDHKDPFDRMLIAQARAEALSVVTADPMFRSYPINTIY